MLIVAEPRLLENILAKDTGDLRVEVLSGILGSGKTSMLRYLEGSGGSRRAVRVLLEDFDPGHPGERGEDASVGAVQGSFHQFARLLQHLIGELRPEERDELSVAARDARHSQVTNAKVADLQATFDELKENKALAPQALADAWRRAAGTLGEEFVRRWKTATTTTPCLLLLDNFHAIADQEIGGWLTAQVFPALTGTVVVLTEDSGGSIRALPTNARVAEIHNFDRKTVGRWLAQEVVDEPVPEDIVRSVHEVSQGHPATLSLVRELLWGPDVGSLDDRRELLRNLPDQFVERGAVLAERLVERQGDDLMRRALQAAAVPRHLDVDLLHHLLGGNELERRNVIDVFRRLARYSFVEDLSGNGSRIRLHSFIRRGLLDRMATFDIPAFKDLNERAADYYAAMLQDEEDTKHPYTSAFVYEDPDWQVKKREWLVHRGQAARPTKRREALVDFSKMFLDAFWWWGNYIHFDFCDQLVADLQHLVEHHRGPTERVAAPGGAWPQLAQLHEALRRILTCYPLRSVKPQQAAWGGVRESLLVVAEVCGLSMRMGRPHSDGLDKYEQEVAAMLNVLLAHTYRYEEGEGEDADRYYEAARALFTGWSQPWALFEWADMHLEQGKLSEVEDLRKESAELVQPPGDPLDDPDEELIANLHRLRADQRFLAGQLDAAATSYGRAVLHAYLSHRSGPRPGDPQSGSPDEYTLQFYVDIRARALRRVSEVNESRGEERATEWAVQLASASGVERFDRDAISCTLREQRILALAQLIFPRGPEVSELDTTDSPFGDELRQFLTRLDRSTLARDLHTVPS
ncbi:hypothetical protein [Nocardioides insulae]|uniref:hypothetical protein n=1 Tax=Nocardioides insulae TaxID=394734 RepID=UPI00040DEC00|nr:hypothetical protein [Nocardioides insulae]